MKQKGTPNLTYTQRLQLEAYLKARLHKRDIARNLGVCLATVYNEIKRGAYEHVVNGNFWTKETRYSPNLSENKYRENMLAKGAPLKIGNDWAFVRHVEKRILYDKLSPGAVLGEIKRNNLFNTRISKSTMYRYVSMGMFLNITMDKLPMGVRKKRYRKTVAKRPPRGTSIEKRPHEIGRRKSFGHWEMDCVCGPTRPTLLVLSERLTRKEIIMPMSNQKAESVIRWLNILERRYGVMFRKVFKSITVDNGTEFSDCIGLERSIYRGKRTSVFYCHPYCSSERGTNERLNREIRRRIPKGSDLSKFTPADIQAVENWVNDYPREILDYATSNEMFERELARIQ